MPRRRRYVFIYAPEILDHLDAIERKHHRLIQKAIDEQLASAPGRATRNRKPLERPVPFGATWELRCGPKNRFRVFYEIQSAEQMVRILAIGVKDGSRLHIGKEEIEL